MSTTSAFAKYLRKPKYAIRTHKRCRICGAVNGCAFLGGFKRQPPAQLNGSFDLRGFGLADGMLFH